MPSTVIGNIGYDAVTRTMFVTFVDGDRYAYFDVPEETYLDFRRSGSKGRFFAYAVRPKFRCRKMDAGDGSEEPPEPAPALV